MFRFLKELYLAEFTSFYRASQAAWSHGYNAGKGAAGVSLFMSLIFVGLSGWVEIIVGKQFFIPHVSKLDGFIITFVIYLVNYCILVIRGHGIRFEREFNHLPQSKQTFLRASCWIMEITTAVFVICSIYAYLHFFHVIPKY